MMKRLLPAIIALLICISAGASAKQADRQLVVVSGDTIIAFFPPISDSELDKDPDLNETLSDFQFYVGNVRNPLRNMKIEFQVIYARSFRIRTGNNVRTFRPQKADVGYYFIAPGKKPRVEYGVMTDTDLIQVAHEYFGSCSKRTSTRTP